MANKLHVMIFIRLVSIFEVFFLRSNIWCSFSLSLYLSDESFYALITLHAVKRKFFFLPYTCDKDKQFALEKQHSECFFVPPRLC